MGVCRYIIVFYFPIWLIFFVIKKVLRHLVPLPSYQISLNGFFKNIFLSLFILRESMSTSQGGAERRRDRIPSRPLAISAEPHVGL